MSELNELSPGALSALPRAGMTRITGRRGPLGESHDIKLLVDLDNRPGHLELTYDEDEPDEHHLLVGGNLSVCSTSVDARAWMHAAVVQLGDAFAAQVSAYMARFEHYSLVVGDSALTAELASLDWDEDDWASCNFALPAEVEALNGIAALIEATLPDTFTTCGHCAGRFNAAGANNCPHCGAAL